ncbi:MAG TPA: DUF4388 domain-containing protein [Pyrinomonadaceae bacterium]|nr:DUF4388 domain-containing protein [Pyrinomonadaceae bacterium]
MALTGELNDLSLAELIEFFCNQRKTGRLKVIYPMGAGYFYLKAGAVVHARLGDLRGIDAVFFALTQPNASFKFSPAFEAPEHSINQPWTSVVLEGLRRMDEGVLPRSPSVVHAEPDHDGEHEPAAVATPETTPVKAPAPTPAKTATAPVKAKTVVANSNDDVKAFGVLLSGSNSESFARRRWNPALVVTAVVVLVAAIGVPWGWYTHKRNVQMTNEAQAATPQPVTVATPAQVQPETPAPQTAPATADNDAELAKRQREARAKERAKAQEQAANADAAKPVANTSANKKAIVTVTYDENGRVTAASGGDATALRIARQKRFPPGKPGSATVTIPIN